MMQTGPAPESGSEGDEGLNDVYLAFATVGIAMDGQARTGLGERLVRLLVMVNAILLLVLTDRKSGPRTT